MRGVEVDWIEPDSVAEGWRGPGLAWLDGDGSSLLGRWSFIGAAPTEWREVAWGEPDPFRAIGEIGRTTAARATRARDALLPDPSEIPAWFGHIAYDAAWTSGATAGLRQQPRHARTSAVPVVRFVRYDAVVAWDHHAHRTWILGDDDDAVARAQVRLARRRASQATARVGPPHSEPAGMHHSAIQAALEAIAAGEIYQVNLARVWVAAFEGEPLALFKAMREVSPVPLGAFLEGHSWALSSRTMERFLRFDARDRSVESRPIKGTIARRGEDEQTSAALRGDAKEQAEHAMIVDLMRNDLGRVADVGSVRVHGLMRVEPYAALSHLVSTVRATVGREVGLDDLLAATFPPGSITGTPKVRAMEQIERLERQARGAYCGAIGHIDRAGGLSLSVAIRTAVVEGGGLTYLAGGGLVDASDPDRELAETELKAKVLLDALRMLTPPG